MDRVDPEHLGLTVEARVEPADEPVAAEHGQHVVPPAALRLRHVDLEAVLEAPERLHARPVVDELVEGRERDRPPPERRLERGRVGDPLPPDAFDGDRHRGPLLHEPGERPLPAIDLEPVEEPADPAGLDDAGRRQLAA